MQRHQSHSAYQSYTSALKQREKMYRAEVQGYTSALKYSNTPLSAAQVSRKGIRCI